MTSNLQKILNESSLKNFKLNLTFSNLLIFISWFGLILITNLYSRFYYYGLSINFAKLLIFISLFVGLSLFLKEKVIRLNTNVLAAIAIIYLHAMFSDHTKIAVLSYSAFYCMLIHYLSVNWYQIIFKQYLWTCKLIAFFALVDFLSFNLLGDFIFAFRDPRYGLCVSNWCQYFPQIMTIFDEPSHMVFYLLPSFMYYLSSYLEKNENLLYFLIIFLSLISTLSTTSVIVISLVSFFYFFRVRRLLFKKIVMLLLFILIAYIFSESYIWKIQYIFMENWNSKTFTFSSSAPYRMLIDSLNGAAINNFIIGSGLYNVNQVLINLLDDPNMMSYYLSEGILDINTGPYEKNTGDGWPGVGLIRLLFGYGIVLLLLISTLLYCGKLKEASSNIGFAAIFTVFLMWLKIVATIELPLAIFFIFGLVEYKSNLAIKLR